MLCVSSGLSTADGDAGKDMMEDLVSLEEIQMRANAIPSSPSPSSRFQERPRASRSRSSESSVRGRGEAAVGRCFDCLLFTGRTGLALQPFTINEP